MSRPATFMIALATALIATTAIAHAQDYRWVPVWGSAQQRVDDRQVPSTTRAAITIRQTVHLSSGGPILRLRVSNRFGDQPLTIGGATLAKADGPGHATVGDVRRLTFAGRPAVTVPPGTDYYSDPVRLPIGAGEDAAVSLYLPEAVAHRTGHPGAHATAFVAPGNLTAAHDLPGAERIGGWWYLDGLEIAEGTATDALVAIGDSITDGHGIADDSNTRWPDLLAQRLTTDPATSRLAVINTGIGGNRVLLDGIGPNLLARFDRDVINRPQAGFAIVLEGVNDLGVLTRDHPVGADGHRAIVAAITGAYREMAARAHAHGIRLIGGTITPYGGNDYYHPGAESEADRQAINTFIRSSGTFDGVIDFDAAVRDPAHPGRLLPAADSGDHLHPGAVGYRMMAEAIPLSLFGAAPPRRSTRGVIGAVAPALVGIAQKPQIALTFDDMPAHGPLPSGQDRLTIAYSIIAALQAHHAPAFGFFNGGFATDRSAADVLALWRRAGFPIGNHTWSHANLDQMTAPAYLADLARNEPILAAAGKGSDWRWFRYPFLSEGSDVAKRDAVRAGLKATGYRIAAVTMSFGDYAWNDAYARCVAKHDDMAIGGLESSYLAAARAQAERSRTLARATLGHDIPYVLLMHLGAFDAQMLPQLLDLYEEMGFGFTTLPQAEADPFYARATDLSLPGPSPTLEGAATARHVAIPATYPLPGTSICA